MWFYIYNVLYNSSYNYIHRRSLTSRMFGTFQPLPEDQEIVYGLVDQPQSYSVMYLEVGRTQPFSSLLHYTTQEMIIFHGYFFRAFCTDILFCQTVQKIQVHGRLEKQIILSY